MKKKRSGKNGSTPSKTTTQKESPHPSWGLYAVHRYERISSSSSSENPSTSNLFNFKSVISWIKPTFQASFFSIWLYLRFLMSSLHSSSIEFFSVRRRRFLRLEPVVERTSCLMKCRRCFGTRFLEFSIRFRKLRNLSSRINFKCLDWETGSIKHLWVCMGEIEHNLYWSIPWVL